MDSETCAAGGRCCHSHLVGNFLDQQGAQKTKLIEFRLELLKPMTHFGRNLSYVSERLMQLRRNIGIQRHGST